MALLDLMKNDLASTDLKLDFPSEMTEKERIAKAVKIKEDKTIKQFVSIGKSKNTNFKDRHWFLLILSYIMTFVFVAYMILLNLFNFVSLDIQGGEMKITGYNIISKSYEVPGENIKPGVYIYYVEEDGHSPVFIENLHLGQIKRTSDLYVEISTSDNELITIPKYRIRYLKK